MDAISDFVRQHHSSQRALIVHRLRIAITRIDAGLHLFGEDVAGHHCIDPHAARSKVGSEYFGQVTQRRLARTLRM